MHRLFAVLYFVLVIFLGSDAKRQILSDRVSRLQENYVEPKQVWNYVNVRPKAFMFWWLYYTTAAEGYTKRPLVIWLQGGPGASSTGYGNFEEIGPLDDNLQPRNITWLSEASLLFIDNPVGTGFSYVTSDDAYTKNVDEIATDLVTTITAFMKQLPDYQTVPLYIFSESYGGKMAAAFALKLSQAVSTGSVKCDLRGVALGDSWISPVDSILTWAPYLYATSLVDETGLSKIGKAADASAAALASGDGKKATSLWGETENMVETVTGGVNFYNILQWGGDSYQHTPATIANTDWLYRLYQRHVGVMQSGDLSQLMNGPIRKKLGIIPDSVVWGDQSTSVFAYQSEDFMKPVVDIVELLLNSTKLEVTVYNGQLDLIVDTLGTEAWVQGMKWSGLPAFNNSQRVSFQTKSSRQAGYYKTYNKFTFYWMLNAGHMTPIDVPEAALWMLQKVIHTN